MHYILIYNLNLDFFNILILYVNLIIIYQIFLINQFFLNLFIHNLNKQKKF